MRSGRQYRIVSLLFGLFLAVFISMAASAQQDGPDYVGASPPAPSTQVGAAVARPGGQSGSANGTLPLTGAAIGTLVFLGVGLVVVGRILSHRRASNDTSS